MQSSQIKKRVHSTRVLVVGLDFLQERSRVQLTTIIYATKIKKLNCTCTCGAGREREGLAVAAI